MKKSLIAFLFLPVIALLVFMAASAGEGHWFDMANCEMCKPLADEDPELLDNMTWEHHAISDGMVTACTVAPAFSEHYARAKKGMKKVEKKIMAGENVKLCNMCIGMADLAMSDKVKAEHVTTSNGYVGLTTSDDPDMVKRIHKWATRTTDEMKKMSESGQSN